MRSAVRDDLLTGGIALAAILLFVGTGSRALQGAIDDMMRLGGGSDDIATTAVLLNIALILFAWRRYKDLRREMAERHAAEARALTLASRDQLTDFLTRASIAERAGGQLAAAQDSGRLLAALVLNLDRFKNVNDHYGHLAGDAILRAVAARLGRTLPPQALCARVGGDEFCILAGFVDRSQAADLARRLLQETARPFDIAGSQVHISGSIGLARLEAGCADFEALLRRADIAMHLAKKAGGDRSLWFDRSMENELKLRNEIEAGLRRAIPAGEILPYYQPQIDLTSGRLHGFEVLARWHGAGGEVTGPDRFIPVAEEAGLIGALFESIFRQSLDDARGWGDLTLSVNISPVQLKDPWLAEKILKGLTQAGFPAARLEIEITESSLFENLPLAQSIVASLKNQGVRLALDDFGTGYSSLAHLRALPFDRIKIDRSFVQSMGKVRESLAITTAIARMGESLGVPVAAEGVEDAAAAAQLREIGCDKGQGWYFGRPLPRADAERLVGDRARETAPEQAAAEIAAPRHAGAAGVVPRPPRARSAA